MLWILLGALYLALFVLLGLATLRPQAQAAGVR